MDWLIKKYYAKYFKRSRFNEMNYGINLKLMANLLIAVGEKFISEKGS